MPPISRLPSVHSSCHSSQVTHWGQVVVCPAASPRTTLCGVRQISTNVANLLKRANALSFASRLGRGVAPLDALFLSLPRVLSAERGGRIRARRFSPFSSFYAPLTSLLVSSHLLRNVLLTVELRRWRLLLRSPSTARALGVLRLCGGASLCGAEVSPSRPQGERGFRLYPLLRQKEKAYVLDVSLAQMQARRQHHLC